MALSTADIKRFIGQGEVYINVKAPLAGATAADCGPLLFVAPGAGEPETGIPQRTDAITAADYVGLTSGPATLEYKPEWKGIEVEQANGEIAPRVTKEMVTVKFTMAEAHYTNLRIAMQTGTAVSIAGAAGAPNKELTVTGGGIFFDPICVAIVSPIGSYTDTQPTPAPHNLFEWVVIYQAISTEGVKIEYKRNNTRLVEVTLTGYADVSRPVNDQLYQHGQDVDPSA
jgi:hypothetical protein